MVDSVVTVRDVFDLPHSGSPEESSPRWQSLREWLNEDLAAVKSPALEDIRSTIEELLNIPVGDIFVASWKETDAIKKLLEESRTSPEALTNVELADHTIKSKHHPHIEVRQKKGTSKKIEFALRLLFSLQGFSLRIQNGLITEIRTGPCEMQGTLQYQGLAVAEQKNGPIKLPEVIVFNHGKKIEVTQSGPGKLATPATGQKPPLESTSTDPGPAPPLIAPQVIATAAPPATGEPQVIEMTAPPHMSAPEEVQLSPDFSSLIPPRKITARTTEIGPPPKVSDLPPDDVPTETTDEEEREVFVL